MKKEIILCLLTMAAASAAPAIRSGGVVNAATNIPLGIAGSGIAQGSYFTIYGTGLGPDTFQSGSVPYTGTLGGVTVTVTPSGGTAVQAFLTYVQATQINAILPSNTLVGNATVTVTYNGVSQPEKVTIVKSSFGIFSTGYPIGAAAIVNVNTAPLYNLLTNAANSGDVLELFGTGLGPITGGDNVAPGIVSPAGIDVKVLAGNAVVTPIYAGRSSQYPGLDQINFVLPTDPGIPDGCFVPIAVQVNGVTGNYATFAKATGGRTCPAPLGLTAAAMQRLDQGAKVNVGLLTLSRSAILGSVSIAGVTLNINAVTEQGGGAFAQLDAGGIFSLIQTPGAAPPLNATGTCLVQTEASIAAPTSTIPPVPKPLDAGSKLTLSGPGSKTQDLPPQAGIGYAAFLAQSGGTLFGIPIPGVPSVPATAPATFIEPGQWTIKGTGGIDVGAFSASITVPSPLNCSPSCDIASIDRTKPLTIQWTGGGGSQDYVEVAGVATTASLADPKSNVAVLFACTAKASDGTLTVPVSVLSQMPASSSDPLAANTGALLVINGLGLANANFTAPLTMLTPAGIAPAGNLDAGYFGYTSVRTKLMEYK